MDSEKRPIVIQQSLPINQENIFVAIPPLDSLSLIQQRLDVLDNMYRTDAFRLIGEQYKNYENTIAVLRRSAWEQNEIYAKQFNAWRTRLLKMEKDLMIERNQRLQAESELAEEKLHRQELESQLELMKTKKDVAAADESLKKHNKDEFVEGTVTAITVSPSTDADRSSSKELKELGTLKKRLNEQRHTIKTLKQKNQSLGTQILLQQQVIFQYEKTLKPFNTFESNLRELEDIKEIVHADENRLQEIVSNMGSRSPTPSYSGRRSVATCSVSSRSHLSVAALKMEGSSEKLQNLSLDS